ncbi:ATP-dependent helicase [Ramlibacter sp. WS9]|nr:ATP-dependent helicase [Ramlibacter sp. WS9]
MSLEDWQAALRAQFGREQPFRIQRLGDEPVFSDFAVSNPESGGHYRVAIRGGLPGDNFCTCPDFATNQLGTCKHIESTLAHLLRKRGGPAALRNGFTAPYSEVYLEYAGQRCLRFRAGADCPPALAKQGRKLVDGSADPDCALEDFLRTAGKTGHEVRCYDDARAFLAELRDTRRRRELFAQAYPQGAQSKALRNLLKAPLYPYQAEGALFAASAGRALIGDEMGLGKTIQAIAAAELLSRHCGVERVLVVCPTSLKYQWQREIARFAGREAQAIHGLRPARQQQYASDAPCWAKITNYETLSRDLDLIQAWGPDLVIVDEAQRIKNWNTIAARSLKRIASPYAIVLTGTPLENRLEELVSIVQFVDQHRLGPTWKLLNEHQQRDEAGRVIGYRALDRIAGTLAPIMLRRRKAQVLDQLPGRIDNTLFVPMTEQQRVHHDENGAIVSRIVQRWRKTGYLSDADQRRLTCALQNMRMSCNSTYLLDHETDHGSKADELMTLLEDLLEQPDAKVVVFSQWVRTHELLIRRLEARGWGHVLFHGGVPSQRRPALVDRFHEDPGCRLFLSTDAGGVGLNLQHAAAAVVNMDLPWNPAVLEQRIGRVHRLGQKRSVQVVNFVAQGTIEEGMLSVLAFKRSLFAGVLDGGESEVFLQGTRLSQFMASVEKVTGAMGEPESGIADESAAAAGEAGVPVASAAAPALPSPPEAGPAPDPWAALADAALPLLQALASRGAGTTPAAPWIERDPHTGQEFLKLPLPQPQTVQRLADALRGLLSRPPSA